MGKDELVRRIRTIAAELQPLTESAPKGAAKWDGKAYVSDAERRPDAYALAWWSMLGAIASLIEAQDNPVNEAQLDYLKTTLLGGMGSLSDLHFDSRVLGTIADTVNAGLERRMRELHASLATRNSELTRRD